MVIMMALLSVKEVDVMRSPTHFGPNGIWLAPYMWDLYLNGSVREREVLTTSPWQRSSLAGMACVGSCGQNELQEHFSHTVMDMRSWRVEDVSHENKEGSGAVVS